MKVAVIHSFRVLLLFVVSLRRGADSVHISVPTVQFHHRASSSVRPKISEEPSITTAKRAKLIFHSLTLSTEETVQIPQAIPLVVVVCWKTGKEANIIQNSSSHSLLTMLLLTALDTIYLLNTEH